MTDIERAEQSTRNAEICRRYMTGETLQTIGDDYHLSRMRIRQIVRGAGLWRKRPNGSDREAFLGVNVTEETKDKLKAKADEQGISMSKLASDALDSLVQKEDT